MPDAISQEIAELEARWAERDKQKQDEAAANLAARLLKRREDILNL
jgi:hypothetical protein